MASVYIALIIHHFLCVCVTDGRRNLYSVLLYFLNVLVLSARATCPATIHDRAVTAARAPMCRNGPVAWTEGGETEERG